MSELDFKTYLGHLQIDKVEVRNEEQYHQEKYNYSSSHQSPSDRYYQYKQDRYQMPTGTSPTPSSGYHQPVNDDEQRFNEGQRYIPPNAHMPVERYVPQPQPQETFYGSYQLAYERYAKQYNGSDPYMRRDLTYHYRLPIQFSQNQFQKIRYLGTPSRAKCCQFEMSRSSPGSSSSNSSVTSGHTSSLQEDIQCQNYQGNHAHYQQEKGTQCSATPSVPVGPGRTSALIPCRHGGCEGGVEYVGASGGRRVCATPPPRPQERCEGCIQAAAQAAAAAVAAVQLSTQSQTLERSTGRGQQQQAWRNSASNVQQSSSQPIPQHHSISSDQSQSSSQLTPRHVQTSRSLTPTNQRSLTPTTVLSSSGTEQSGISLSGSSEDRRDNSTPRQRLNQTIVSTNQTLTPQVNVPTNRNVQIAHASTSNIPNIQALPLSASGSQTSQIPTQNLPSSSGKCGISVQRAISMPTSSGEHSRIGQDNRAGLQRSEASDRPAGKRVNYSQSERTPRSRPPLNRSLSKKEMIKNYIKKETANFFGVGENEDEEQQRWLDRRKRMASRTMGPLKEEYATLSYRTQSQVPQHIRHRRTASEAAPRTSGMSGQLMSGGRPDVLPGEQEDITDGYDRVGGTELRRKDSVARMTWNGLNYVVTTLTRHKQHPRSQQGNWSRSFPPETEQQSPVNQLPSPEEEAEAFFEKPVEVISNEDTVDRPSKPADVPRYSAAAGINWPRDHDVVLRHAQHRTTVGSSHIPTSILDNVLDNSNRKQYGTGWIGRVFGNSYRKSVVGDARIQAQIDDMDDNRPFFTYWVTAVQILVLLISILCYGLGPFGFNLQARSGQVLVTSLSLQQVDYMEPANFWIGPRAADLIHLGAKFAPCMRLDDKIMLEIEKIRKKEKETACCIRNDDSGCVQSSQADCSKTISTWKKWTSGDTGPGGRISGSVCGLDPKYCDAPPSVHPYEWPDDITKWPICRKTNTQISQSVAKRDKGGTKDRSAEHMVCEVIGHPCCLGIHGQCHITTREYCDFVRGTFHEEASLCSQVSCLNDVCGMVDFYFPDTPDQFYRLWTSLFLHAGILQLIITVVVQYFLMRDLEKLTGSLRIGIIYIGSGVAGNLASAIFVPYRADVGPAGSQFGLLACLIVEVLNSWKMLKHPNQALCKLLSITTLLFFIGLLPWVDNYAHLFGFMFGFLLSYALLPFVSFGPYDKQKKIFLIWVCLLTALILFIVLILLFYIIPVYDCKICSYFNCLPLTRDFCASQNINFKREDIKV